LLIARRGEDKGFARWDENEGLRDGVVERNAAINSRVIGY